MSQVSSLASLVFETFVGILPNHHLAMKVEEIELKFIHFFKFISVAPDVTS